MWACGRKAPSRFVFQWHQHPLEVSFLCLMINDVLISDILFSNTLPAFVLRTLMNTNTANKVYSVGMYCTETLKEKLSTISRTADKGKQALVALRNGVKEDPCTFLLEMNFKVGAEKMANAIAESVSPRYDGPASDVEDLKRLIQKGVSIKGAVKKGDQIQFDCSEEGLGVTVCGKDQGNVASGGLASAFCDVYLDDKSVSPTLADSCLAECCSL